MFVQLYFFLDARTLIWKTFSMFELSSILSALWQSDYFVIIVYIVRFSVNIMYALGCLVVPHNPV